MVQPWTFKVKRSKHTAKIKNPLSPTAPSVLSSILSAPTSLSPNPSKSEPQERSLDTNTKRKDKGELRYTPNFCAASDKSFGMGL